MNQQTTLTFILALAPMFVCVAPINTKAAEPLIIGSKRELFVDNYLIDKLDGTRLVMGQPKEEGVVFKYDKPWEGRYSGYGVFIKVADGDFRYYYRGSPCLVPGPTEIERQTCVAYSKDGIIWERPNIGKFELYGSKNNNVILMDGTGSHNFAPFLDARPGVPKNERFKALAGERFEGLYIYSSPDGLNWKKMFDGKPVLQGKYLDAMNVAFWSESEREYVLYGRVWKGGWKGFRWIARSTSKDLQNWSPLEAVRILHDGKNVPDQHYYHSGLQPYFRAPHIYVSLCSMMTEGRFMTKEQIDTLDIEKKNRADARSGGGFMTTRGGMTFERTFMEEFIRPPIGLQEWLARCNYPVIGVLQTSPTEISIYVDIHSAQPTHAVRRYSLRLDGFSSLYAPFKGGEMVTKPFVFKGNCLSLNFATASHGEILLQFETPQGEKIEGYQFAQCRPIIGNSIDLHVMFRDSKDLATLASQPVRLRIRLKDANLYSLLFQDIP